MNTTEVMAFIIQLLASYIFVSVATNNASKQTVLDQKTDLRTTKEDLMSELKDTREAFLRESEISTTAIIDIIKAELKKQTAIKKVKTMKYKNKKAAVDGVFFDSKKEARRYAELKLMLRAGVIKDLELQKPFELIPAQYESYPRTGKNGKPLKDGKRCIEKSVVYKADFAYIDTETGELVVEDTKGVKTKDYIIKRKLMLYIHGIKIKEI